MSKTSESGNARNLGNFEQLLTFCRSYGTAYNPSKPHLLVAKLSETLEQARQRLRETDDFKNMLNHAVNQRASEFKALRSLSTRVLNAFSICGAGSAAINDIKGINRKIQGKRAVPVKTTSASGAAGETASLPRTASAAQTSYDFQVEHFSRLAQAATLDPAYQPNEPELTKSGLTTKLNAIQAANTAYMDAYTKWSNARMRRDFVFNDPLLGLLQVAASVKKYIKAAFGAQSPQYKQVSGLEFAKTRD